MTKEESKGINSQENCEMMENLRNDREQKDINL